MLFPGPRVIERRIRNYPERESAALAEIWNLLGQNQTASVQEKILLTLGRWNAYRNQGVREKNENFIEQIFANQEISNSLKKLIQISKESHSLDFILSNRENDIEVVFNWLVRNLFLNDMPARIVTVSKTLLMLCGFSLGLDTKNLKKIQNENKWLLCCPGVWPFHLYLDILKFVAQEQIKWEQRYNRSMGGFLPDVPIGQIMDRALWERG